MPQRQYFWLRRESAFREAPEYLERLNAQTNQSWRSKGALPTPLTLFGHCRQAAAAAKLHEVSGRLLTN